MLVIAALCRRYCTLNANGFEVLLGAHVAWLYYIVERQFDLAEVKILIDIQGGQLHHQAEDRGFDAKVASLAGSHKAAALKVIWSHSTPTPMKRFTIPDSLENTLQQKCKASFRYFDLNEHGERVYRKDGERYLVNQLVLFIMKIIIIW